MNEQVLNWANLVAFVSFAYPLWLVWRNLRATSLRHTVAWLFLAWLGWLAATAMPLLGLPVRPVRYVALCLSACVFVAVLGARRPGMGAWNFVVLGFLAVMSLPLVQQPWQHAVWELESAWAIVLGVIVLFAFVNYLGTPFGMLALCASAILGSHLYLLVRPHQPFAERALLMPLSMTTIAAALAGTIAIMAVAKYLGKPSGPWKCFRDCYGLVWGKRVQEQFNAAAKNAGWHVRLHWFKGLQPEPGHPPPRAEEEAAMLRTLQAVLKPFAVGVEEKAATA